LIRESDRRACSTGHDDLQTEGTGNGWDLLSQQHLGPPVVGDKVTIGPTMHGVTDVGQRLTYSSRKPLNF
jgi:hypothetical protein